MAVDKIIPAPVPAEVVVDVVDAQPSVQPSRPGAGITRYPVKMRHLRTLAIAPTVVH